VSGVHGWGGPPPGPLRRFLRGFSYAGQGVWYAIRTQRNVRVQLVAAAAAVTAGAVLGISPVDWACVSLAIGMVIAAEIVNTVVEALIDLQTTQFHPLAKAAKDGAAGAVLVTSIAAVGVALAVFVPRLLPARGGCYRPAEPAIAAPYGHQSPYSRHRTMHRRPPMSARTSRAVAIARRRGPALPAVTMAAAALLFASAGCAVVSKINHIRHAIESNKTVIDGFTAGLKSGKATPFQATYVTTGSSPTTVTYAVQPPKDISFKETSANGGTSQVDLIGNASGEYSCSRASSGSAWTCQKLAKATAATQNELFSIYTPSHWVSFLEAFSIAAGIAGDHVTTSTMSVNGFSLKCVDFTAKGVKGTSTICTTAQNILGYVSVAQQTTSFEIKSYTATPPASAFQLPPGASITNGG